MFAVGDIDDVVARLRAYGAKFVGEVAQYERTSDSATSGPRGDHLKRELREPLT